MTMQRGTKQINGFTAQLIMVLVLRVVVTVNLVARFPLARIAQEKIAMTRKTWEMAFASF